MKRKLILVLGIVAIISVLSFGCLPSPSSTSKTPVTTGTATDTAQNARIDELANELAQLEAKQGASGGVSQDAFNSLQSKVNSLESSIGNKANQSDLTALQTRVTTLETDTSSSSSSSSGSSSDGSVLSTDGDLKLILDSVNPSSEPVLLRDGGDDVEFELTVENTGSTWHEYMIYLRMSPEKAVNVDLTTGTGVDSYPDYEWSLTRSDTSFNTPILISSDDTFSITKLDSDRIVLTVTLNALDDVYWNWDFDLDETR